MGFNTSAIDLNVRYSNEVMMMMQGKCYYQKTIVSVWKNKSPNTKVPLLWDNYPLWIKTDLSASTLEVQKISVKATVDSKSSLLPSYANMSIGLSIYVDLVNGLNEVKIENHATNKSGEMKFTMPSDNGELEIWTLYKLNRKLHVTFKGVKVWEMDYIKLFDAKFDDEIFSQRSMKAWSKRVQEIWFDNEDTATLNYRQSGRIFNGIKLYKIRHDNKSLNRPELRNRVIKTFKNTKQCFSTYSLIRKLGVKRSDKTNKTYFRKVLQRIQDDKRQWLCGMSKKHVQQLRCNVLYNMS